MATNNKPVKPVGDLGNLVGRGVVRPEIVEAAVKHKGQVRLGHRRDVDLEIDDAPI